MDPFTIIGTTGAIVGMIGELSRNSLAGSILRCPKAILYEELTLELD